MNGIKPDSRPYGADQLELTLWLVREILKIAEEHPDGLKILVEALRQSR